MRARAEPRVTLLLLLPWLILTACQRAPAPLAVEPVMWSDPDTHPFAGPPEGFYSSYTWDGANNSLFRPLTEVLQPREPTEAANVNAFDEVPSSSWYVNRLSRRLMSPEEVARGPCEGAADPVPRPWTIVGGKPDGANPGFEIRDADGVRYLLKTDGRLQRERASAADAIAARIWHAAGFNAPCNRVVFFERDAFRLDPDATIERADGSVEPLTRRHVDEVLSQATLAGEDRFRASLSRYVTGEPISHWRYEGLRDGDPNDVVPHEDRRELRAQYVLSAWTNHIDSRQENTMATWIRTGGGRGYVRHYVIDFGDAFGVVHESQALSKRFGHSGYFDVEHLIEDLLTAGRLERPWERVELGAAGVELGYYDAVHFVPDRWRPGYPNPAYDRMTEADAAWMARIVARFGDDHIRALVEQGRFSDPAVAAELTRILAERRDLILERWLTRVSPLAWPVVGEVGEVGEVVESDQSGGAAALCMQDVATWSGIRERQGRRYEARAWAAVAGAEPTPVELPSRPALAEAHRVCVRLPPLPGASPSSPRHLVVDLVASSRGLETTYPARLHLVVSGDASARLVGLERPSRADVGPPRAVSGARAAVASLGREPEREPSRSGGPSGGGPAEDRRLAARDSLALPTTPRSDAAGLTEWPLAPPGSEPEPAAPVLPPDERRPLPDYDDRPPPAPTALDLVLAGSRVALRPPYLVAEYLIRRPLGWVVSRVEQARLFQSPR